MIVLIRSNDANPDPRLQKYINYLELRKIPYKVIAWNREGKKLYRKNFLYFERKAKYGMGYKNIPNKLMWFLFIIKQLIINKEQYRIIHACDLDTVIPSYFVKIFLKKKIIFDVFDWVSQNDERGLRKIISYIENSLFKNADYTILCEEYRLNQIKPTYRRPYLVLPNIPDIDYQNDSEVEEIINKQKKQYKTVLSYVGVFDSNRGIEDIINFVANHPTFVINIAGFGRLQNFVLEKSRKYNNIIYWGKVEYNKGLNIMRNSDLIIAFYYLSEPAHKYAAPNKYYESLFLGKPILTNNHTELSKKIREYNTGITIDQGFDSISYFFENEFNNINLNHLEENAKKLWESKFRDYTKIFMETEYKKILFESSHNE